MRHFHSLISTVVIFSLISTAKAGADRLQSDSRFTASDYGNGITRVKVELPSTAGEEWSLLSAESRAGAALGDAVTRWVIVPEGGDVSSSLIRGEVLELGEGEAGQSHLTVVSRNAELGVTVGRDVRLRGVRMVPVTVPRASRQGERILVNRRVELEIRVGGQSHPSSTHRAPVSEPFARVFERSAVNPPSRDLAPSDLGRMLVIYPEAYRDNNGITAINRWVNWKRAMGLEVSLETINFPNEDQDDVKALIRQYYEQQRSLDYVVFIGYDSTKILGLDSVALTRQLWFPNFERSIDADPPVVSRGDLFYVTMDGDDDVVPDVLFGRMIVTETSSLQGVLNRSELYERDPYPGPQGQEGRWYRRALITTDKDVNPSPGTVDMLQWVPHRLLEMGIDDVDSVFNVNYAGAVRPTREALERGMALAFGDGWLLGAANHENMNQLAANGRMFPFVVTGFQHYGYPIVPRWFSKVSVNTPRGPVAGFGFDWDPYTPFLVEMIGWATYGMRYEGIFNGGELHLFSHLGVVPTAYRAEDEMLALFDLSFSSYIGDPSVNIFNGAPATMRLAAANPMNVGATLVRVPVNDADGNGIAGATVCIKQGNDLQFVNKTGADGVASFTIPDGLVEGQLQITAYKHNHRTVQAAVNVTAPRVNLVLENGGIDDAGGNNDGELSNGETVRLVLQLRNRGDQAAEDLTARLSSDSRHISFSREEAAVANINGGATGTFTQPVNLTLSPRCPGGTVARIEALVSSGNTSWPVAFELTTAGPRLTVNQAGGQNLARGARGTLRPAVRNSGSRPSTALTAVLESQTAAVRVIQGNTSLQAVAVDAVRPVEQAFEVLIDSTFVPGEAASFSLRLHTDDGMDTTIAFWVQIGVRGEGDPAGPDDFGYVCLDDGDAAWRSRPRYEWIEINPDIPGYNHFGTRVNLPNIQHDSLDISTVVPLPFEFQFYGEVFDSLTICSNGWVAMGTRWRSYGSAVNQRMPGVLAPAGQISAYWLDLRVGNSVFNGAYTHYLEERGLFIIEWSNMLLQLGEEGFDTVNVQIWLHDPAVYRSADGNGDVVIQYRDCPVEPVGYFGHRYPTVGIRSVDGRGGLTYTHGNDYSPGARALRDRMALRFTTGRQLPVGVVRGRVVEALNENTGVEGVTIDPRIADATVTDAEGWFTMALIAQDYQGVRLHKPYYTPMDLAFEVPAGDTAWLEPIRLPRPVFSVDEGYRELHKSLAPDGHRTQAYTVLRNSGAGELTYSTTLRYRDGSLPDFDTTRVYHLNAITGTADLQCYGGVWVDSLFYIPAFIRNNPNPPIFVIDRNGRLVRQFRQPTPVDENSTPRFNAITWDGEKFWGGYRYLDRNWLVAFDMNGQLRDTIPNPFNGELQQFCLTYSPERRTLFATDWARDVVELDMEGQVLQRLLVHFSGRLSQVSGLGWNSSDPDGKMLYLLDTWHSDETQQRPRLLKMNPDDGRMEVVRVLPVGGADPKAYYGIATIYNWDAAHTYIGVIEKFGLARNTRVFLKVHSSGPYLGFLAPGSFFNPSGSIPARRPVAMGFELDASDMAEGEYGFAYFVRHSALGDSALIPVTLTVDAASSADDRPLAPLDFALHSLHPNPFNGRLSLTFSLNKAAYTRLTVFDLQGRETARILEGRLQPGRRSVSWDADGLPSGVFIVQLEAEGLGVRRAKAVLVK